MADTDPCRACSGSGVIETGNDDLPCECTAGDEAIFNLAGIGRVTGREVKLHYLNAPEDPR